MTADRGPGDFGNRLREARERRGVSLRQIANATKISISALEALEKNAISRLPGGIFSRAFVRSYALEVGLDPEETIQEFIAQFPHDSVTAGHPTSEQVEDNEAIESNRRMATTFLRLILVSVPVAGVVLYFGNAGRPAVLPSEGPSVVVAAAPETVPVPPPAAAAVPTTAPAHQGSAPTPAAPDRLTIVLSASRASWLSATVDGGKSEGFLQAGERRTIEARQDVLLTVGDAGAVTMTLNGAAAKPLGKTGDVVTRRLDVRNFKEYLATP
jgi:cytoskeleton protein RodZ